MTGSKIFDPYELLTTGSNIFDPYELLTTGSNIFDPYELLTTGSKIFDPYEPPTTKSKMFDPNIHHRRSVRLKGYDYTKAGLYFITVCVESYKCLFGNVADGIMVLNECGKTVENCWNEIPKHYPDCVLHEFVVMPNHLHGIVEIAVGVENFRPNDDRVEDFRPLRYCAPRSIGAIVRGFKIGTTKKLGASVWQRNYYEHIIRDAKSHNQIADYIIYNPSKWEYDKFYA